MGKRLFVGNLSYETLDSELRELFSTIGTCQSATIMIDRATGRSRGFAFVEMSSDDEALRAVAELNGRDLRGRGITVSEARERGAGGGRGPASFLAPGGYDFQSSKPRFSKEGGSRRGLRARKRSL